MKDGKKSIKHDHRDEVGKNPDGKCYRMDDPASLKTKEKMQRENNVVFHK